MSEKKFTPYEVAMAILKKSQEVYNKHTELKKAEELEKSSKAEDKEKGVHKPHYMAGKNTGTSEVGAYQGSGAKLHPDTVAWAKDKHKEVMDESKKIKPNLPKSENMEKCGETKVVGKAEDLKKLQSPTSAVPGSVATTGGPSIASQIGFGKGENNTTREQRVKEKEKTGKDLSRIGRNFEIRNETSEEASKRKSHEADVKTLVEANKPKVDKKLPDFLKKKFMKKNDGAPKAPTAAAGSPSNSPQSPKVAAGGLPPVKEEK